MTPRPHSPCTLPPPRKICRTPPSPDSKRCSFSVQGFDAVLVAVKHVFASLFNDRAISYRACIRVTITAAWRSPPGCRGWSAPIWPPPASCSPSIPNPALARWCLSPLHGVWARWWCRAQ
ncbi:hypothetical protein MJK72_17265 [Klebsiella pneumoniae]|nr:hypothetical protein MJK72_17265 [Klebsiella pneumoniae]